MVADGCGLLWVVVGGFLGGYGWFFGWLWVVVSGCGWSWMVLSGCGWLWMVVGGCGRLFTLV